MKAIHFDMLGTLLVMAGVLREEIRAYLAHCVAPVWRPLELPEPWLNLKTFPDVKEGIERLRTKYQVTTLSNAPVYFTRSVLEANGIKVDAIVGLEYIKRFKPHPECYMAASQTCGVEISESLMVTANPTFGPYPFGDLEIAGAIGMKTQLIRNPGCPQTIIELAEKLGC